jgi:holin-like protein
MLGCILRIMLFLLAGELTVTSLNLVFPASLCGMIYLLLWLKITDHRSEQLESAASFLIGNMGLLFVPAGAAIITFADTLRNEWPVILVAIVISTAAAIAVAGLVAGKPLNILSSRRSAS